VLFDLDNTLVDRGDAFARWAAEFTAQRRLGEGSAAWLIETDGGGFGPKERFFGAVRERFGLSDSVAELWAAYRARMPHLVRCRPEVLAGLAALRAAGWRIGIVTNGMPDNQHAKIERTGLAAHIHGRAVSGELGIRKPDPRIFRLAAEACGADPADGGWAVGDSPDLDVAGGRAAGLNTFWISRHQPWPPAHPHPDRTAPDAATAIGRLLAGATVPHRPASGRVHHPRI
jgi:putative hydrolase of the HAD superfamily